MGLLPTAFAPYRRLAGRILQGPGTVKTAAFRRDVICLTETVKTRPAICLPGQLERVTSSTEHLSLETEMRSMLADEYTHAPTYAYHIRDAVLYRGSIYAGTMRHFLADPAAFRSCSETIHLAQAGLSATATGYRYFGHWMCDDCPQYILALNYGRPLCVSQPMSSHMSRYADCFGQDWAGPSQASIDNLIVFQDFAQNSLKRLRYQQLSEQVARAFPTDGTRDKLIYIRRGLSGVKRLIEDEDALIETLIRSGFEVLDVGSDFATIVSTLRRARLVVSMEGSNINHFYYCAGPDCGVVTLQPSDRFTAIHRHWSDCIGLRFGLVVGDKVRERRYMFSTSEILKTVELMLKQISSAV